MEIPIDLFINLRLELSYLCIANYFNSFDSANNMEVQQRNFTLSAAIINDCNADDSDGVDRVNVNDITSLRIIDQNVLFLPTNLAELFPQLQRLSVRNSRLTAIDKSDLIGLGNLLEIAITGNNLTSLPGDLFSELLQLQTIDISDNGIAELPIGIFTPLSELRRLNISNNALTSLQNDLFAVRNNIEAIDFSGNSITNVARKFFRNLKQLKVANFANNSCLDSQTFDNLNLSQLKSEILDNC